MRDVSTEYVLDARLRAASMNAVSSTADIVAHEAETSPQLKAARSHCGSQYGSAGHSYGTHASAKRLRTCSEHAYGTCQLAQVAAGDSAHAVRRCEALDSGGSGVDGVAQPSTFHPLGRVSQRTSLFRTVASSDPEVYPTRPRTLGPAVAVVAVKIDQERVAAVRAFRVTGRQVDQEVPPTRVKIVTAAGAAATACLLCRRRRDDNIVPPRLRAT
eukprot:6196708-Pleurochrysis_carterae.AAC.2